MALRTIKTHCLTSCRLYFSRSPLKELKSQIFKENHEELEGAGVRSYSELTGHILLPLNLVLKVDFGNNNIHYINNKSLAALIIRQGLIDYFTEKNLLSGDLTLEEKLDKIFHSKDLIEATERLNINQEDVLKGFLQEFVEKRPNGIAEHEHFINCFDHMVERIKDYLKEPSKISLCA